MHKTQYTLNTASLPVSYAVVTMAAIGAVFSLSVAATTVRAGLIGTTVFAW